MIESILTEWSFRLESGYPKCDADYDVLRDVLREMTTLTESQQTDIIQRAKGYPAQPIEPITEEVQLDSIENDALLNAAQSVGKLDQLTTFLRLLPTEANATIIKFLNSLGTGSAQEFINMLYSRTILSEETLNQIDYTTGLTAQLFNLEPKGLGKGEILLAVLFEGAEIQGSGKSYDMVVSGQRYELKDYTKKANSSIRLGTKSVVTQFSFWDEIITTLKRLSQLRGTVESPKFDFSKYFNTQLLDSIAYLDSRRGDILSGKLNLTDKRYLQQFYDEAAKINNDIQGYTNVILRGPNATPLEFSIKPIQRPGDTITITPIQDDTQDITYINAELRRLKYVRNPAALDVDLQAATDTIVGTDLLFIVFRKNRVNVTRDFQYHVVDTGRIRILEKSISIQDTSTDSEQPED
jgi:hypothetical protein